MVLKHLFTCGHSLMREKSHGCSGIDISVVNEDETSKQSGRKCNAGSGQTNARLADRLLHPDNRQGQQPKF